MMTYRLLLSVATIVIAGFAYEAIAESIDPAQWLIAAGVGYVVGAVFK